MAQQADDENEGLMGNVSNTMTTRDPSTTKRESNGGHMIPFTLASLRFRFG